ncbi:MAG: gfo/Idh/MocA family oxidoreductase [Bacteroidetes bacterium]|nr:MAG: gfo/Idh/MocA family oxidoreductase [Bacteroidota bacterium]
MQKHPPSRREALKTLGLTTGALAFSPGAILRPRRKERLGVALVGLGYYSTDILAPALQETEHCYLAGIVTGSPDKVPVWQEQYQIPDTHVYDYASMHRIANNPDIDVIYIVLPNGMHAEYVVRAAATGKHVWCEKPMAMSVAECTAMIAACEANKVSLSIGYRMQHEPNTQKLMGFAGHSDFGRVQLVSAAAGYREGRAGHWKLTRKLGGGAMYDMGVYPLQAARYAVGEEPIAVLARHSTTRPDLFKEVDETTLFQLEFPGGAVAQCATSFGMSMNYLHVTYEKGWANLDPFSGYQGVGGSASQGHSLAPWPGNQQARQMDEDALAIMEGKPMRVPGEEGMRDIRIVEAIYRSAQTGQRMRL